MIERNQFLIFYCFFLTIFFLCLIFLKTCFEFLYNIIYVGVNYLELVLFKQLLYKFGQLFIFFLTEACEAVQVTLKAEEVT